MKRVALGIPLISCSLQALAHDGHGVDPGSVVHYLSAPHLLLPVGVALCVAGVFYAGIRHRRKRR